jgi:hypothetical protein
MRIAYVDQTDKVDFANYWQTAYAVPGDASNDWENAIPTLYSYS